MNRRLPPSPGLLTAVAAIAACWGSLASAEEPVNFERDIWPIFEARCNHCHGAGEQQNRLRLDSKAVALRGGISGPAVVAGSPEKSLLIERIASDANNERMPFDDEPLSAAEIALVTRWIREGAKWPDGVGSDSTEVEIHWAYVPPQRPVPPPVKGADWVLHPIDRFILARLERENLAPSPPASKEKLLRRLSLDLTGLPPTIEELDDFLADDSAGAYEAAVDRLLASQHFGERWARPWLDAARYADSNGYQADQYREVWPYRDYVIDSLNADKPFDQFTLEQLAGDLLPDATLQQKIASGFHRLTTCNLEAGVDPEENRVNQVIDRVNTTGYVWLGTSIECAQCHNHKYDPISQADYYRLFAYFNNTPLEVKGKNSIQFDFNGPSIELPLSESKLEEKARLEQSKAYLVAKFDLRFEQVLVRLAGRLAASPPKDAAAEVHDRWHPLTVASFVSTGGADHEVLPDQSVLVSGAKPATDTYVVELESELPRLTGLRLEALTHDSLPGKGPGRHHAERPNFVLHEIRLERIDRDGNAAAVTLIDAEADYSQPQYHVAKSIDGDAATTKSGWAIHKEFHKPHWASFRTIEPVDIHEGDRLRVTLVQNHGEGRTLGRIRLSAMTGDAKPRPLAKLLTPELAMLLEMPQSQWNREQEQQMINHCKEIDIQLKKLHEALEQQLAKIAAIKPATTLVMVEDTPRDTFIFRRGDFKSPTVQVEPRTPRALTAGGGEIAKERQDRIDLAQWLTSRDNPLTARVQVNRAWAEIFGRGIVATTEDFGTQGEPPTHPQVLDWLAVEFMESGWSFKHLVKQIVMSATYRQSSAVTPQAWERDPENELLARGPRFRLSAEAIRDNALVVSGLFSPQLGGPPVFPPQPEGIWRHVGRNAPKYATSQGSDRFRRGIYTIWRRSAPPPSFMNFDAPDRASCVVRRPRTNTPLQALTLMNDLQYVEMAAALAGRMIAERADQSPAERAAHGFRLATSRRATAAEIEVLTGVYQRQRAAFEQEPRRAEQLLKDMPVRADGIPAAELAAWTHVANVLLNLDETITKE